MGVQCKLCCNQEKSIKPDYDPDYGPGAEMFWRSDTQIIDDIVQPWTNKNTPALEREKYLSVELEQDKLNTLLDNWWDGSFSIPAPPSYSSEEEKETKKENVESVENIHNMEIVDFEDLFRRLMNMNIYTVAEYMAQSEPFCLTDHIVNSFILISLIIALCFILSCQ